MKAMWIIDGYNLILGAEPLAELPPGELARRRGRIESLLVEFGRRQGSRPLVVYDGQEGAAGPGPGGGRRDEDLEVVFVAPPAEADDLIVQRLERHVQAGETVHVVTSDRRLAVRVDGAGARWLPADSFRETLAGLLERREPAPAAAAMPDVEAHFLDMHREEMARQEAARRPAPPPVPPAAAAPDPGAQRRERREKGRRRQERRLQAARKARRRRRH